ncbi:hypothetical protein J2Z21_000706 [Streptomyces griseochromogenes]|uniref:Uncharacterized protein n=1 Tax=Streptomyces griseochromogenes TaxID=68214 RepID=A0ABS4LK63_9ACTN|nr:hypothetical protein [Streptomyces griseochromogenes]
MLMGDHDEGGAVPLAQGGQQVHDAGRGVGVEGRGDFVAEQDVGVGGQGTGDGDALALSAGQFAWVAVGVVGREFDLGEEFGDAIRKRALGQSCVQAQGTGQLMSDGTPRSPGPRTVREP